MVIALLALLLVGAAIAFHHYRNRNGDRVAARDGRAERPAGRSATAEPTPESEPEPFRILALGPSGSGKTVFLASAYNAMFLPRKRLRRKFFLKADDASSAELRAIHRTVIDAKANWPPGTDVSTFRRHHFDVMVKDQGVNHRLIRLEYVDYAGELLDPSDFGGSERMRELRDYFEKANALFVLIDGRKLADYIRGDDSGTLYFGHRIDATIQWLVDARCPIHFVVTKWDLVRDIGEDNPDDPDSRLAVVRREIERHPNLRDLLATVDQQRIRLIPVSAVGDGFAKIGSDQQMKKIDGAQPRPINVEIPFVTAIPDFLSYAQTQLDDGRIHELRQTIERASDSKVATKMREQWRNIQTYAPFFPVPGTVVAGVDLFANWVIRAVERESNVIHGKTSRQAKAELEELQRVQSFLRQLERITNRFDDNHPAAMLRDPLVGSDW